MNIKNVVKVLAVLLGLSVLLNLYLLQDSMSGVNKALEENTPPTADVITWERAQQLIGACQVSSVSQTHDLQVLVQTKTGDSYAAVEPEIDAVFKEVNAANCEDQPVLITE